MKDSYNGHDSPLRETLTKHMTQTAMTNVFTRVGLGHVKLNIN